MRHAENNSSCTKLSLWTKKNFNKVAKQQIIIEKKIRLKALLIPADNEKKRNFLYEKNLPKDL